MFPLVFSMERAVTLPGGPKVSPQREDLAPSETLGCKISMVICSVVSLFLNEGGIPLEIFFRKKLKKYKLPLDFSRYCGMIECEGGNFFLEN